MEEDIGKVNAYLLKLNTGPSGPWVAADGFYISPEFTFGKGGQSNNINAGTGIVVKVFFNNLTGEVKTVLAQAMVKNA